MLGDNSYLRDHGCKMKGKDTKNDHAEYTAQ